MGLKTTISIAAPELKVNSGTKTYVENVFKGLDTAGVNYNKIMVKKHEISIKGKPFFGFLSQYANALFKSANTSVVHALSPDSVIKGTNLVTVHDIIPLVRKDIYFRSFYDKLAFSKSIQRLLRIDNLLLSTEIGKTEVMENLNVDEERIRVLHLSIDHGVFFPSSVNPYLDNGKIKVLMVSDFNPRKRIDLAIKALRDDDEIDFYHIGPDNLWERKKSEAVEISKGANNIHILGAVGRDKLRDYISYADLFVYLTEAEGFGFPPIEAMACGTNVLVSDLSVFHETLRDKASFVNNKDFTTEDIKKALSARLDPHKLVEYSRSYSIEKYASGLLDIYKSIGRNI